MKTMIAIPCMDMVHTVFMKSLLGLKKVGETAQCMTCSTMIYDARNMLAQQAIKDGYDRILWLDSDMEFDPDIMLRLSQDLDEGREYVSAMYYTRRAPIRPVVYNQVGYAQDGKTPAAINYVDYPRGEVFEVAASGMGACMMTTGLVKRVFEKFGYPFSPILGFGEDLSFCLRATELGEKMHCDSRIQCGHVGQWTVTEDTFRGGTIQNMGDK